MSFTDNQASRLLTIYEYIITANPLDFEGNNRLRIMYFRDLQKLSKSLARLNYRRDNWQRVENIVHQYFGRNRYGAYSPIITEYLLNTLENLDDEGFWTDPHMF